MKKSLITFLCVFTLAGVAEAQYLIRGKTYKHIANEERLIPDSMIEVLGVRLWDSHVADVIKTVGESTPMRGVNPLRGKTIQICYQGTENGLILEFPSSKYANQDNLCEVYLFSGRTIPESFVACTPNSKITKSLTVAGGLQLGMTRDQVRKIWGKEGFSDDKVMIYWIRQPSKKYFTDDMIMYLEFTQGKLSFINQGRVAVD